MKKICVVLVFVLCLVGVAYADQLFPNVNVTTEDYETAVYYICETGRINGLDFNRAGGGITPGGQLIPGDWDNFTEMVAWYESWLTTTLLSEEATHMKDRRKAKVENKKSKEK